jgi:phosphohistidine swiveling domain-containing protein
MNCVIPFSDVDKMSLSVVGGKGANLGEMSKAGFPVPGGMCISTIAYEAFIATSTEMHAFFLELQAVEIRNLAQVGDLGRRIREHLEVVPIPGKIVNAITVAWSNSGEDKAYAVRSSATAEDLPSASFAGQQDTYLAIRGLDRILDAVRRCWASLFTDRAIVYRARNHIPHQDVSLSVVIQEMVLPAVSGIMFTADPITGNRKIITIDASYGLGEAVVSGLVEADMYQVRGEEIVAKKIGSKKLAIYSLEEGGTVSKEPSKEEQESQALSDAAILRLAALGRRVESHYGCEQDIEWCVTGEDELFVVQSRPITTLYPMMDPLPTDDTLHVYMSFGHMQMMTKAVTPMGRSVLRTIIPSGHSLPGDESSWAVNAGSHLYLDLSDLLRVSTFGEMFPKFAINIDERISVALQEVVKRPDFHNVPPPPGLRMKLLRFFIPFAFQGILNLFFRDPRLALADANSIMEETVSDYEKQLNQVCGSERVRLLQLMLENLFPKYLVKLARHLLPGIVSMKMVEKYSKKWLGDSDELAIMNRSLPGNVTTEMGLRVGDLGDCVRGCPEVLEYLKSPTTCKETFRKGLEDIKGGNEFLTELDSFLMEYGMRCSGEIDIGNERWNESPTSLISSILTVARNSQSPGDHRRKHVQANENAEAAAHRIVERVRNTPWGYFKAMFMRRLVTVFRYRAGMREHPKYTIVRILWIVKRCILEEATGLVCAGTLRDPSDVFYIGLTELSSLLSNTFEGDVNLLIALRKNQFSKDEGMQPVRVLTSEGEVINGTRQSCTAPEGAILGTGVSAGVVEGFARVVLSPENAELEDGEIMVSQFTDPGWTPLFNSAKGLVIVVGGMLTHGAVVAREYGIPAVVGVDNATEEIKTGQYVRVDGNEGYVLILPTPDRNRNMRIDSMRMHD